MKINSIRVQNFRNIEFAETNFKHINYIFGLNNAGKSSLMAACQYAICNTSPFSSKMEDLMKKDNENSNEYTITEVNVDKLGTIRRQKRKSSQTNSLNNEDMPDKELLKEFKAQFGYEYSTAELMFDGARFTSMTPKEQKAFLLKLTGISLNYEQIVKYMDKPNKKQTKEVVEAISNLMKDTAMSIDDIEKLYQYFFSQRTLLKKDYANVSKQLEVKEKEIPTDKPRVLSFVDKDLNELETKLQEMLKEQTIQLERLSIQKNANDNKKKQEEELQTILSQILENVDLSDEKIETITSETHKIEVEQNGNIREHAALVQSKDSFEKMKNKLNTDKCPLSDKLICTADKSTLLNDFDLEIEKATKQIKKLEKAIEKNKEQLSSYKNELDIIHSQKLLLEKKNAILESIEQTNKILGQASVEVDEELSENIVLIKTRIEELRKEKSDILSYTKLTDEITQLKQKVKQAKEDVDTYEYLVKEFAPNGVRSRILEKIINPLQTKASNMISKITNDYSLSFGIDDNGFVVNVTTKTGTIPMSQLSESEKLRIQIVIQDTINSLTGVGILVIDEAGILDKDNFEKLNDLIVDISPNYGNIFILATQEKEFANEFAMKHNDTNLCTIWMENGSLSTL